MWAQAAATALLIIVVVLRPAEIHWWRAGHISNEVLAFLLVARFPTVAAIVATAVGAHPAQVIVATMAAGAVGALLYRPAVRKAEQRHADRTAGL